MPNSDISKINNGDTSIVVDDMFQEVFEKSNKVYKESRGWFDPTVGILVNAWGFGPNENIENLDTNEIQNKLKKVGFNKVYIKNNKVIKKYKETYFDFNALAKGYAVDVLGRFLEKENINNQTFFGYHSCVKYIAHLIILKSPLLLEPVSKKHHIGSLAMAAIVGD